VVTSKIENTIGKEVKKARAKKTGLTQKDYRTNVKKISAGITQTTIKLCGGNLLTAKIALWQSIDELAMMLSERKE